MFASRCQRVRLHFPAATAWEPSVTIAAYDTPTGEPKWRARFDDGTPEDVIGSMLCAVAHDLAQPDRYDQQRALRGPVLEDSADCLAPLGHCPGAASAWCGCRESFGLERTYHTRMGWRLWGKHHDGRLWQAWFDQATPAHLIAAACHPLAERTCAYAQIPAGDLSLGQPYGSSGPATVEAAQPDVPQPGTRPVIGPESAPFETVLAVAREVAQQTGRTGARAIATGVRARGIAIGTKRAQRIAAVLRAESDAALR